MDIFDLIYFKVFRKSYIRNKIVPIVELISYKCDLNLYWVRDKIWRERKILLNGNELLAAMSWLPSGDFVISIKAQTPYTNKLRESIEEIFAPISYRFEEFRVRDKLIWYEYIL